jgi:hypothetical protein
MRSIKDCRHAALIVWSCLLACSAARVVDGGNVYVAFVVDPPTTAFSGVPTADGFTGTSTRSGPGTWHLYAVDDVPNTFGIKNIYLKISPGPGGTVPSIQNRLPLTSWDDSPSFGSGNGPFTTGLNNNRSSGGSGRISGQQDSGVIAGDITVPLIDGFGQTSSNFKIKTGGQSFDGTLNGQWGNYADFPAINFGSGVRHPLFMGEGTYTGSPPTIDTTTFVFGDHEIAVWTNAALTNWTTYTVVLITVPEPTTSVLSGAALLSVIFSRARRK